MSATDRFKARFCYQCARHMTVNTASGIEECEDGEECEIMVRTFLYSPDSTQYPDQWRYTDDGPICTAFVEKGQPIPPLRDERTVDMFEVSPVRDTK